MKLAFDENVPLGMVRVFQTLAHERQLRIQMGQFEVVSARDYTPKVYDGDYAKKNDVPWLTRFAKTGGKVVISGDRSMLARRHELLALKQHGFVVIMFEGKWSQWDFFRKSSLLLHYWGLIAKRVRGAKAGTIFCVPGHWREDADLRDVTPEANRVGKASPAVTGREEPPSRDKPKAQQSQKQRQRATREERTAAKRTARLAREPELDLRAPAKTGTNPDAPK